MAITDVNLIWEDENVTENAQGVIEFRQQWRCISDNGTGDNVITALNDPRLPQRGNALTGSGLTVRQREARREDGDARTFYLVTITYSNGADAGGEPAGGPPKPNPMEDELIIRGSTGRASKPYDRDVTGALIKNWAGDVPDPLPEKRVVAPTLSITKNFPTFSFAEAIEWANTVNETTYQGAEKDRLLLAEVNFEGPKFRNEIEFWTVTYVFEYAADETDTNGWQMQLLSIGFNELVFSNGEYIKQRIKINGEDTPVPQLIAIDGTVLTADDIANGASPEYIDYQTYKRKDFNQLPL